jgi:uncharacterized membrane protein YfcA
MLLIHQPTPGGRQFSLPVISPIAGCVGVVGGIYGIGGGSLLAPILILGGFTAYAVAPAALLSTLAASIVGVVTFVILGFTSDSSTKITPDWASASPPASAGSSAPTSAPASSPGSPNRPYDDS